MGVLALNCPQNLVAFDNRDGEAGLALRTVVKVSVQLLRDIESVVNNLT